jgi:hypothetical protein
MANPSKGGDAKLWVYHPAARDQDCQVAEANYTKIFASLEIARLVLFEPYQLFVR